MENERRPFTQHIVLDGVRRDSEYVDWGTSAEQVATESAEWIKRNFRYSKVEAEITGDEITFRCES